MRTAASAPSAPTSAGGRRAAPTSASTTRRSETTIWTVCGDLVTRCKIGGRLCLLGSNAYSGRLCLDS
jgi:hypothetical protein